MSDRRGDLDTQGTFITYLAFVLHVLKVLDRHEVDAAK